MLLVMYIETYYFLIIAILKLCIIIIYFMYKQISIINMINIIIYIYHALPVKYQVKQCVKLKIFWKCAKQIFCFIFLKMSFRF